MKTSALALLDENFQGEFNDRMCNTRVGRRLTEE
jgi:hypothetical protein